MNCQTIDCKREAKVKGYCKKHYYQVLNHGAVKRTRFDPNPIIKRGEQLIIIICDMYGIPKAEMLIDKEEYEKIMPCKIAQSADGYAVLRDRISNKVVRVHRKITGCPEEMYIDHINHNKLDNRLVNLRICTPLQSTMNKYVKGVTFDKKRKRWRAQIMLHGRGIHLGRYVKKEDALIARYSAEKEMFKEYAVCR